MKVHLLQAQEDIGIERRREGFLGFTVRARVWKGNEILCFIIIENSISNCLPVAAFAVRPAPLRCSVSLYSD